MKNGTVSMTDVSTLINSTVFLKVRFQAPGNSRKVSGADVLETDADKALLRVSKQLLSSPELEAIKRSDFQTRAYLYNVCHPFDMGVSLLPLALVETVDAKLTAYATERAALVDAFISAYPGLCDNAGKHLGSLFDAGDYLTPEGMRSRFSFSWEIFCFTVPEQLKGMNTVLYDKAKDSLMKSIKDAAQGIEALMTEQLSELVSHLYEKLTPGDEGKPKILRDTAVKNISEWLELFQAKNVTNFKQLEGVVSELNGILQGVTGDKLRNSDLLRDQIRQKMTGVKQSLAGMVVEKPGRVFREE